MATRLDAVDRIAEDPVSNGLKWILLVVAAACFAALGWMTDLTYKAAPPVPDRFVFAEGTLLMSSTDIQAGKAGFQEADLMDYGSLYGMGSYFGEDYTAANLVRLATHIQLGRAFQISFFAGPANWSLLVSRAMWPIRAKLAAATR